MKLITLENLNRFWNGIKKEIDKLTLSVDSKADASSVPTKLSQLTNDAGYLKSVTNISGNAGTATKLQTSRKINGVSFDGTKDITITDSSKVAPTGTIVAGRIATFSDTTGKIIKDSGYTIATSVPANAKFTDTTYSAATTSANGLMTSAMVTKLNGIATGANNYTHPSSHPASIITQDASNRFVSDTEKSNWNAKETTTGAQAKADAALASAKSYADTKVAGLVNSAPAALDTLNELSKALGDDPNFATTIATQMGSKADTSYVNTELAKKANSSHGTHVTWATTAPKANGTAAVGTATKVAREDHVHPLQTTISGNAGSASKLNVSNKGTSLTPVYFSNGVPVACGFTVESITDRELDNLCQGIITFSFFGGSYRAKYGMTWREWVSSSYCTDTSFNASGSVVTYGSDGELIDNAANTVYSNDTIVADMIYSTMDCCFDAGSKILMANGTTKNIEDVVIGDEVVSLNTETGEFITQKVKNTITNPRSTDLVYVNLSNGTKLAMRAYHPLLTVDGWKSLRPEQAETKMDVGEVKLLEVGDILVGYNENVEIISVEARPEVENYCTYNLGIEGHHNYIVDGIVAHNAACPT